VAEISSLAEKILKPFTGKHKVLAWGLLFVGLAAVQYFYLTSRVYPSPARVRAVLLTMKAPGDPATRAAVDKLRSWDPGIVCAEIKRFCLEVETPVRMESALRRAAAVSVLSAFFSHPRAVETLVALADSPDGILRRKVLHDMRYQWSESVLATLEKALEAGDVRLTVRGGSGDIPGPEYSYGDFDKAAAESLAAMYGLWRGKRPDRALAVRAVLEKARANPRLRDIVEKALK